MKNFIKAGLIGLSASILLLTLYFLIMTLAQSSLSSTLSQLDNLKFWVIPLIITFGIHVGLFTYARDCTRQASSASATVGTTTSSAAMIACCAHHITDLPLVGLSVFATFLTKYQVWFFAVGIFSNLIGIGIVLKQLKTMGR